MVEISTARWRVGPWLLAAILVGAGGCARTQSSATAGAGDGAQRAPTADPKDRGATKESGGGKSGGGKAAAKGGRGGDQKQAVEVVAIARHDLSESLRVVGSLAPNETATIRPEMNGLIREIHFEEGRRVKKGDLLVRIEDSELKAQLAQSKSRHELAKLNLARAENLRQTKSNTEADVDRARSEFSAAEADLDLLRVRLARTELRAPFDGVVGARTLSAGDYVNTQSVITTLNDLSRLKVEFQVPERYLAKVRPGTKFGVKSTSIEEGGVVDGEVYFVNSVIDRTTRSSEVKGYVTGATSALKAGMFAEIEVLLEMRKGALAVPEGAILIDQRGPQLVTVAEQAGEKIAAFVPVQLGLRSRGLVEVRAVKGELSEKDLIVAAGVGSLALFQGAKLDPRPLRQEFRIQN